MSEPRTIFRIEAWRGVWRVTRDGAFYGDYRTLSLARDNTQVVIARLRGEGLDPQLLEI